MMTAGAAKFSELQFDAKCDPKDSRPPQSGDLSLTYIINYAKSPHVNMRLQRGIATQTSL